VTIAKERVPRRVRETSRASHRPSPPQVGPLLLDTNVLLDAVLVRAPWAASAVRLLALCGHGQVRGLLSVHAIATVYYVVAKSLGAPGARAVVAELVELLTIVELGDDDVRYALTLPIRDFEDALHVAAARRAGASHIITRNDRDFRGGTIPILSPGEVLALLAGR